MIRPDDPRIVTLIEEIMLNGARPDGANSIDWNPALIADLIAQTINQYTTHNTGGTKR